MVSLKKLFIELKILLFNITLLNKDLHITYEIITEN